MFQLKVFCGLAIIILSGCCNGGGSVYCPCVKPDDLYFRPNQDLMNSFNYIANSNNIMEDKYGNVDTLKFGMVKKTEQIMYNLHCNHPKQTCCSDDHFEYFTINLRSNNIKRIDSITISGSYPEVINNSSGTEVNYHNPLVSVRYNKLTFDDAILNLNPEKDTLNIFSITKGFIIYTDNANIKWKRIF